METFCWAGWRDEAKKKVVGSVMDKAYVGPSTINGRKREKINTDCLSSLSILTFQLQAQMPEIFSS